MICVDQAGRVRWWTYEDDACHGIVLANTVAEWLGLWEDLMWLDPTYEVVGLLAGEFGQRRSSFKDGTDSTLARRLRGVLQNKT